MTSKNEGDKPSADAAEQGGNVGVSRSAGQKHRRRLYVVIVAGAAIIALFVLLITSLPSFQFFGFGDGGTGATAPFEHARRFRTPATITIILHGVTGDERRAAMQLLLKGLKDRLDADSTA